MLYTADAEKHALLTVVTVTRNDHVGLARTAQSIAEQMSPSADALEWLVISGSDDVGSDEAVLRSSLVQRPPQLIVRKPQGVYAAMNAGLEAASGTFVHFLNSGDTFADPQSLDCIVEAVRSDTDLQWVVGRVRIIDRTGRSITSRSWRFPEEQHYCFARGVFPPHQATIVRTETLRQLGGFDTEYSIAADYHASLRLSLIAEPRMIDMVIAEFLEGGVSTTRWKHAAAEFHRARLEVLAPSGSARLLEGWNTAKGFVAQFVYRDLLRRDR